MDRVYEVRYKGRIEHRECDEHNLVELVRSGQVSGVHAYRAVGTQRWMPVFRMEFVRGAEGRWAIVDEAQPAKPQAPVPTPAPEPVAPQTPQITNPSVVIMNAGAAPYAPPSDPARPDSAGITPKPSGGLSIAGFVLGLASPTCGAALFSPALFRLELGVLGAVIATVGIVLSACGLPTPRRRGFAIAGMVIGIVALIAWGAFIAAQALRAR